MWRFTSDLKKTRGAYGLPLDKSCRNQKCVAQAVNAVMSLQY